MLSAVKPDLAGGLGKHKMATGAGFAHGLDSQQGRYAADIDNKDFSGYNESEEFRELSLFDSAMALAFHRKKLTLRSWSWLWIALSCYMVVANRGEKQFLETAQSCRRWINSLWSGSCLTALKSIGIHDAYVETNLRFVENDANYPRNGVHQDVWG